MSTSTPQRPSHGRAELSDQLSPSSAGIAVLVSMAREASSYILEHSTFPFASLGCSNRFAESLAVWEDYSFFIQAMGRKRF